MKVRKDAWTKKEDNILRQYFSNSSKEELCKLLPNRTLFSIRKRAYETLCLDKGYFWTESETQYLLENYEKADKKDIVNKIGRVWGGIKAYAQRLGLSRIENVLSFWSIEEEQFLAKIYPTSSWPEILAAFPNRKRSSINEKASSIGIRRQVRDKIIKVENTTCKNCKTIFYQPPSRANRPFCSKKCSSEYMVGENAPTWKGGKSFEPYPATFNEPFKRIIRERDNYTCAICKEYGNSVHHINYVKNDTVPENCITLCRSCHTKTNSNREYWLEYFTNCHE